MEVIKTVPGTWEQPAKAAVFWKKQKDVAGGSGVSSDSSLRSITPHTVRSRLTLFSNVIVDQSHSLAIHNIRKQCTIHHGLGRPSNCGSVHYGFCQAIPEPKATKQPQPTKTKPTDSVTQSTPTTSTKKPENIESSRKESGELEVWWYTTG